MERDKNKVAVEEMKKLQQEVKERRKHIEDIMEKESYLEEMYKINDELNKEAKLKGCKTLNYKECKKVFANKGGNNG